MVRHHGAAARRTTMSYTLAEAAAAVGMDKTTIRRAVRSGRISGTRDDVGVWHVEPTSCTVAFRLSSPPRGTPRAAPRRCRETHPQMPQTAPLMLWSPSCTRSSRTCGSIVNEWREQAKRIALAAPVPAPAPVDAGGPLYRAWRWMRKTG